MSFIEQLEEGKFEPLEWPKDWTISYGSVTKLPLNWIADDLRANGTIISLQARAGRDSDTALFDFIVDPDPDIGDIDEARSEALAGLKKVFLTARAEVQGPTVKQYLIVQGYVPVKAYSGTLPTVVTPVELSELLQAISDFNALDTTSLMTVTNNIGDINAVADDLPEINSVATALPAINQANANEADISAVAANIANVILAAGIDNDDVQAVAANLLSLNNAAQILDGFFTSRNSLKKSVLITNSFISQAGGEPTHDTAQVEAKNIILRGIQDPNSIYLLGDVSESINFSSNGVGSSDERDFGYVYVGVDDLGAHEVSVTSLPYIDITSSTNILSLFSNQNITHYTYLGYYNLYFHTIFKDDVLYLNDMASDTDTVVTTGVDTPYSNSFRFIDDDVNKQLPEGIYDGYLNFFKADTGDVTATLSFSVDDRFIDSGRNHEIVRNVEINLPYVTDKRQPLVGGTLRASLGSGTYRISLFVERIIMEPFSHPGITITQNLPVSNEPSPLHRDSDTGTGSNGYGTLIGAVNGTNTTYTVSQGSYTAGTLRVISDGSVYLPLHGIVETDPAQGIFDTDIAPSGNIVAEYN